MTKKRTRLSDEMSLEAYDKIRSSLHQRHLAIVEVFEERGRPLGTEEVAHLMGLESTDISPRLSELRRLGFIRESGDRYQTSKEGWANRWELCEGREPVLKRWKQRLEVVMAKIDRLETERQELTGLIASQIDRSQTAKSRRRNKIRSRLRLGNQSPSAGSGTKPNRRTAQ